MLIYNGQIIAGGGTIVLPMTRAEYEANKAILDSADVWVDLTDEPDDIATADQVAFWVGQTQKSVGYIGDIATKALAKVEPTDTALYSHEVGTYFINKDGNMCMTDLQIAIGGTIVLGTNCHVVDGGISSDLSQMGYHVIASSSSSLNTYASKLAELESAYDNLTLEQKQRTFICNEDEAIFSITDIAAKRFSSAVCVENFTANSTLSLSAHTYFSTSITGNTIAHNNYSSSTNTYVLKLCIR